MGLPLDTAILQLQRPNTTPRHPTPRHGLFTSRLLRAPPRRRATTLIFLSVCRTTHPEAVVADDVNVGNPQLSGVLPAAAVDAATTRKNAADLDASHAYGCGRRPELSPAVFRAKQITTLLCLGWRVRERGTRKGSLLAKGAYDARSHLFFCHSSASARGNEFGGRRFFAAAAAVALSPPASPFPRSSQPTSHTAGVVVDLNLEGHSSKILVDLSSSMFASAE